MINTLGIVRIRRGPRGVNPKLERKLGGKSLVEWIVRRVTDCQRLDAVAVVLEESNLAQRIRAIVPPDVPLVVGPAGDSLARVVAATAEFAARHVVCLAADNPFVDPVLIDRLVSTADAHPRCDYISYCRADGRPAIHSPLGVLAEWCSADALARANREARHPAERASVTGFLVSRPDLFQIRLIPLPTELDRDDLRLGIDHEEDWEHAQVIFDALGAEEWDWRRVAELLDHQPALRRRMAALNGLRTTS